MRSGTLFFNWTVFKKTVARFWPIWAAYLAYWVIILPIRILMEMRYSIPYTANSFFWDVANTVDMLLPLAVIFGVMAAMAVCSHLYNHRSANFFGSLPVRREGLFLTHYLAGLSFLWLPNLIVALLTLLAGVIGGGTGAVSLPALGYWLLIACVEGFFFYTFAVFCGMFAGHILALPAFYGIFNALAAAIYGMFYLVLEEFYYGFNGMSQWTEELVYWLTPIYRLSSVDIVRSGGVAVPESLFSSTMQTVTSTAGLQGGGTLAIYAIAGLVLAAGSFLLYRKRRLESAGDVVAVAPMRPVFKYSVSFCAGLFLGYLTAEILGGGDLTRMIAIVFWAVVGCFVAQMILDKTFRVFRKWKGPLVMAGVFCLLFAVVIFDLTGFETCVPHAADVTSVEVSGLSGSYGLGDSGDYTAVELTDPTRISYIVQLHRAAVDQRDADIPGGGGYVSFTLTYHLKDGAAMSRSYDVYIDPAQVDEQGTAAWALEQLYTDRALYWTAYGFDKLYAALESGGRLESADYGYYNNDYRLGSDSVQPEEEYEFFGDYGGILPFYGAAARELLDAVREDFQAGNIGVRHVGVVDSGRWGDGPVRLLQFWYSTSNGDGAGVEICVSDTAENTLRVLYEHMAEAIADLGYLVETESEGTLTSVADPLGSVSIG